MEQGIKPPDGFKAEECISADTAHLGRHMIDDLHLPADAHGVGDLAHCIFSWAPGEATFHCGILCVGVIHFGLLGSYTVIIIRVGRAVVHTMCSGPGLGLYPRQHSPRVGDINVPHRRPSPHWPYGENFTHFL